MLDLLSQTIYLFKINQFISIIQKITFHPVLQRSMNRSSMFKLSKTASTLDISSFCETSRNEVSPSIYVLPTLVLLISFPRPFFLAWNMFQNLLFPLDLCHPFRHFSFCFILKTFLAIVSSFTFKTYMQRLILLLANLSSKPFIYIFIVILKTLPLKQPSLMIKQWHKCNSVLSLTYFFCRILIVTLVAV